MDVSETNPKQFQGNESWMPNTPLRPRSILPKPQFFCVNGQESQIEHANEEFSPDFFSSRSGSWEVYQDIRRNALNARRNLIFQTWSGGIGKFTSLVALQDQAAAARAHIYGESHRNADSLPGSSHLNSNCGQEIQYGFPVSHGHVYDLNLPPPGPAIEFSSQTASPFAPVTPEKSTRIEYRGAQMQYFSTDERENQGSNKQGDEVATAVDNNRIHVNEKLQKKPEKDADEKNNPENEGSCDVNISETPEQKPRKKKHRPKVITEGKPRTPKPATPAQAPAENSTGKRKYVRRVPLTKASTTTPDDSTEKPTGKRRYVRRKPVDQISTWPPETNEEVSGTKAPEPDKTSCRRSLNFDTEGQTEDDDSAKGKHGSKEDSQPQPRDVGDTNQSKSTVNLGRGIEVLVETTETGIAYDLNSSINQILQKYISLPGKHAPNIPSAANTWYKEICGNEAQMAANNTKQKKEQIISQTGNQLSLVNPNSSDCRSSTTLTDEEANGSKRKLFSSIYQPGTCSAYPIGILYDVLPHYQTTTWFPSIAKRKRTEKAQSATSNGIVRSDITSPQHDTSSASSTKCLVSASCSGKETLGAVAETDSLVHKMQSFGPTFAHMERLTKKRSRGPTRTRDMASLINIERETYASSTLRQAAMDCNVQQVVDLNRPHTCVDALVAEMRGTLTTKKRTKKTVLVSPASSRTTTEQTSGRMILYSRNLSVNSLGPSQEVVTWRQMNSTDKLAENIHHLNTNRDGNSTGYIAQNAIVPYKGKKQQNELFLYRSDGAIIPYSDSFVKKRRLRAQVHLDEETNRVWKLLLGNINSEGIDGTDEEKTKWWEEERDVFRGRANSFIARMHLVQGDRRFSQWKGSIVDSVVGVFLTQNVSDHLSSSAFMSLAACFPLKSQSNSMPCYEERTGSVIEKPIVCMPDQEDAIKWNEETPNQSICDQSSITLIETEIDEEREVIYSYESSTSSTGAVSSSRQETYYESIGNRSTIEITRIINDCGVQEKTKATDEAMSSQNSVISSQHSENLPAQTAERTEIHSENNMEAGDVIGGSQSDSLNSCSSLKELLSAIEPTKQHEVHSNVGGIVLSNEIPKDEHNKGTPMLKHYNDVNQHLLEVPNAPSNSHCSPLPSNLGKRFQLITEDTRCSNMSSKNRAANNMKDASCFTEESASQITDENNLTITAQMLSSQSANGRKIEKEKQVAKQIQNKDVNIVDKLFTEEQVDQTQQKLDLLNISEETVDTMESSSALNMGKKDFQRTESDLMEHSISKFKKREEMTPAKFKQKSRRVGEKIRDDMDWDSLRIAVEANGKKRERTPNTMDSLDWEAVRTADVSQIADAIKERGMNNILAERIKNFLNRLVKEHGSIDLEWLRDLEPDRAKEYLLSIRGLGLKSVECVRLLTLHHLAFPVDTNVGRIAVRLGWVPLQPLPESLQLHLLELYPVLESIQKYLWPRLCKLDQRTLYELHYQLITFGKVFCTKSKPNCNACPMRGECRHFASAFASSRLALPGPEEKGIVTAAGHTTNEPNTAKASGRAPLPLPQAPEQSEANQLSKTIQRAEGRCINGCEPIIEEPSSPEPECTQAQEVDLEDTFCEDPDEIPMIKLNIEEFTQNLQNYVQNNMELQEYDMSKAIVALTTEAASIPTPKLKNVKQLRTEHQVYELPDSHPLLEGLDRREPDDPCPYLLAIWTPGETANSIQPPERSCNSQGYSKLCDDTTCFSCNSTREAESQIVRGTLLIPCRTAMRGSFPLNGTYFQVNEVFADHDSSLNPIDVPRSWIWNLPRRTVYFGTSVPTIFKGLTTEEIQHCFWRGFICVRGFEQKTRAPRPLKARLHFPASKTRGKGKNPNE